MAINDAMQMVQETGNQPVPLHLRNAPTNLMKELGYSKGYKYAHDYEGNFVLQQFLPDELKQQRFWHPQQNPAEDKLRAQMEKCWGKERFQD